MADDLCELEIGERLEEFEITAELGRYLNGETFLAWDTRQDRWVAVEQYLSPWVWSRRHMGAVNAADHAWALDRCLGEARARAALNHPCLLRVHRVIEARESVCLVADYVDGWSLKAALVEDGPWSESRVRRLLLALLGGVGEVHEKGLLHEDIRPANVMLLPTGDPVLIGCGSARRALEARYLCRPSMEETHPPTMFAPDPQAGPWSDIYALGAVAYEALTGRSPDELLDPMRRELLPGVGEAAGRPVSGGLVAALTRALTIRRADDRLQSAGELAAMLAEPETAEVEESLCTFQSAANGGVLDTVTRPGPLLPDAARNPELFGRPPELPAGEMVGQYRITGLLERERFEVTYLAHDSQWTRVVIKEFLPDGCGTRRRDGLVAGGERYRRGLQRFLDEARALASIEHPHLLQTREVIEARGTAYWVTEYVEGRKLKGVPPGRWMGTRGWARVRALVAAVLGGLAVLHEAGRLHLDIRPAHILLRSTGEPVLIGFGAARQALWSATRRDVTRPLLPCPYAPIEQHEDGHLGPWTDIYALGAVWYELLAGGPPDPAAQRLRLDRVLDVGKALGDLVDADFAAAIMTALAVHERDRPRSVGAWRAMFDRLDGVDGGGVDETGWVPARTIECADGRNAVEAVQIPLFRGSLEQGDRVNQFVIQGRLGAGAFGATYLALDTDSVHLVALKEYAPYGLETGSPGSRLPRTAEGNTGGEDDAVVLVVGAAAPGDERGVERFRKTAWALTELDHPHLSRVLGDIQVSGTVCLVTEYVNGRTLADTLAESEPWTEAQMMALLNPLLDGMAQMHAAGWLHRDIKPGNVMLRETGIPGVLRLGRDGEIECAPHEPVLIDFDTVWGTGGRGLLDVPSAVTSGYAPIELYGNQGDQGPWTDIYALGALAYEGLTGRAPDDAMARVREDRLPDVAKVAEHAVSRKLAMSVMRALAVEPRDRPQTIEQWQAMLGDAGTVSRI